MSKMYPVNEIFYSLQGEGYFSGTPAVFVRFSGCNLACPFCDTEHRSKTMMSAEEIVGEIKRVGRCSPLVVLTGGEPSLFVDDALIRRIKEETSPFVCMETNGTKEVSPLVDFVTVSPKADFVKNGEVVLKDASEVKVVYDGKTDVEKWLEIQADNYYLQPCDTGDAEETERIKRECVEYIKEHPYWRLSLQTHKILNIR